MVDMRTFCVFFMMAVYGTFFPCSACPEEAGTRAIAAGVLENWPPQYLTDEKTGAPQGFAIDIMDRVAEKADLKIRYIAYSSWPDIVRAIERREIAVVPNMGITRERAVRYDFTVPYETSRIVIFVRSAVTGIQHLDDLAGKTVGGVKDNQGVAIMKNHGQSNLVIFPSLEEAFLALLSGRLDALVYPKAAVTRMAMNSGLEDKIKVVGPPLLEIKRGIAVKKGEEQLYRKINRAVSEVVKTRDYRMIYEKWFGASKPYRDVRRAILAMGALLVLCVSVLLFLRNGSINKLNRRLLASIAELEQSRKLLEANEAFLNKTQSMAHVGSWRYDVKKDALYWSDEVYRICGLSPGAVAPTSGGFLARVHPEDRAMVEQACEANRKADRPYEINYRIIRSDGTIRCIHEKVENTLDDSGRLMASMGTVHDITEIRAAETALRQREAELNSIFRAAPAGIGMISDRIFKWANDSFCEMTGYGKNEIIGTSTQALYLDQDEFERVGREIYPNIEKAGTVKAETTWVTRHGHPIDVLLHVTPLDASEPSKRYIVTALDISSRKKAEQRVMDSERNYREIFNAVNDVLVIHDATTGAIIDVNSKVTELYGYDPDELKGRTVECLSSGDLPYSIQDAATWIEKAIAEGPQLFEWMARSKSGETFWVEVNLKNTAIGGVDRLLAVIRDIRRRKATELELNAHRAHLQEMVDRRTAEIRAKNAELETFTYSVSHDLKAPLRGIDGYSRLLVEDYADRLDEEGLLFLDNIRHSTEQMHQLIEDLLTYSRMERRDLTPSRLNIRQLIDELVFEREHEITARSARLTIDIARETIVSDRESLRQILGNFIDNAIKFTSDEAEPTIDINVLKTPDRWQFAVMDNGIGFDMKYHDRIFGIFQRLHRSEDFPGTGVGLALVKKAAARMGGRTWAQSRPGQGATFYLEIPELQPSGTKIV